MTPFENKCDILADLWLNLRYDEEFVDFISYNDLGLPLAYALSEGIVEPTDLAKSFINETFTMLLGTLGLEDTDEGYGNLSEMLGQD